MSRSEQTPDFISLPRPQSDTTTNFSFDPHAISHDPTDDDDDWGDRPSSLLRPQDDSRQFTGWRRLLYGGGLGRFLFSTPLGWCVYVGILVAWLGGCGVGLILLNRIVLWSAYLKENYTAHTKLLYLVASVPKFPYPITTTYFELVLTHLLLLLSAFSTRWASSWLKGAGLAGMIAPCGPSDIHQRRSLGNERHTEKQDLQQNWITICSAGIAGGGIFEFDLSIVKQVFPMAFFFVAKMLLSNLSFASSRFSSYILFRLGIMPFSLLFTSVLRGTKHSGPVIISVLFATASLGAAAYRSNVTYTKDGIVLGILASVFAAVYPVQIPRTHRSLLASLVPQGEMMGASPDSDTNGVDFSGTRQESQAYWQLLHYTSVISILMFTPIVIFSGEISQILKSSNTLDTYFHWFMIFLGGICSWAVFFGTIALTRATSPLTATFLFVPRGAVLVASMLARDLGMHNWIGFGASWSCCAWFIVFRLTEGKKGER